MSYNAGDIYRYSLFVEGKIKDVYVFGHVAWIPVSKFIYGIIKSAGYNFRSLELMTFLNILLTSLSASVLFVFLAEVTSSVVISFLLCCLVFFSFGFWFHATGPRLYGGAYLGFIGSLYYCYKYSERVNPFLLAIINSASVLFNLFNVFTVIPSMIYINLYHEKLSLRFLKNLAYLSVFFVSVISGYYFSGCINLYDLFCSHIIRNIISFKVYAVNYVCLFIGGWLKPFSDIYDFIILFVIILIFILSILNFNKLIKERLYLSVIISFFVLFIFIWKTDPHNVYSSIIFIPAAIALGVSTRINGDKYKYFKYLMSFLLIFLLIIQMKQTIKTTVYGRTLNDDVYYELYINNKDILNLKNTLIFADDIGYGYLKYYYDADVISLSDIKRDLSSERFINDLNLLVKNKSKKYLYINVIYAHNDSAIKKIIELISEYKYHQIIKREIKYFTGNGEKESVFLYKYERK